MEADIKPIMDELRIIRQELDDIKSQMPNKEMFLSTEEKAMLNESFKNEKSGALTSSYDLRKELGI
ncbi:MAG: hypothetical protein KKF44_06575 [Nanoarchaeota archaeon]|nr:hypothetical protein [Nanoarchaeota archaeon]